ncbi:Mediator of RNA polymerase II transcription subunit 26 [Myotis davidii]|uniref:Mediator of RNA polymerase II transcription subunit 26 n=1 Tax=Myotis davidii TaxID=225400 RepID=L5LL46_MYODS|nr:Mediator of RNA polymerase II transcription subunit 26 [Myotis davidii]
MVLDGDGTGRVWVLHDFEIRNMVAVLEVISSLEKYPITKEALEETRLGKLINDVRKKTKNEELAKRAKKLLRNWQKLIEPVHQNEAVLRGLAGAPGSANGGGSPESFPGPLDSGRHVGPEGSCLEQGENDKHSIKIPINAVRPHTSSPSLGKPSGPCLQSKAAVLQQLDRADETSGPPHPKGPPRCSFSPRNSRHEGSFARQRSPYSPKGSVPSPLPRPQSLDVTQVPSPLPLAQPSTPPVRRLELLPSAESPVHWLEQPEGHQRLAGSVCKAGLSPAESILPRAGFSPDSSRADSDAASSGGSDSKKKRKQPRDYTVNLGGQVAEAGVKPVRLKERKLTFDPMTRQIKPLTQKEPVRADSPVHMEQPRTELDKPEAKTSLQSPFEQTNWKELSRNEIIQSYLSRQSSLLSSSGAQTPGAHHFMSEYLKQEESTRRGARTPHVLLPPGPFTDLPGLSRQVTQNDLDRIQAHQWPGVNGCLDTQGNWYDWTQCISLDPHGDDGRLNILPYVCLD